MAIKSDFHHPSSDISHQSSDLSGNINKILLYFSNFDYIPTIEEIYTFYPKKISKSTVGEYCNKSSKFKVQSAKFKNEREKRKKISEHKVHLIQTYLKLLSMFPQIKLIGLSGTVAMNNAQENDDIDLFIITAKNRIFTGRLISIVMGYALGVRRRYKDKNIANKVCLNLFFDENNLQVPKYKQTEYVAHEVLQMRPLINRDQIYERFLKANAWVFGFFPNAKEVVSSKYQVSSIKQKEQNIKSKQMRNTNYLILNTITNKIEQMVKNFQLHLIRKHRTTEIITDSQLWFFPDDYEEKIIMKPR